MLSLHSFQLLVVAASVLVKERGRNLNIFEHLIQHNGSSLESNVNSQCVGFDCFVP